MSDTILVQYRGELAALTACKSDVLQAADIGDVLRQVKWKYGGKAHKLAKAMLITVDGKSISLSDGFKTKLAGCGEVMFLPVCGGG